MALAGRYLEPVALRTGLVAFAISMALCSTAALRAETNTTGATGQPSSAARSPAVTLDDVVVTAAEPDKLAPGGTTIMPGNELRAVPQTPFTDLATGLKTLPGVAKAGPFSALLYIRGSQPYETLYVLNGVPLFNPYAWGGTLLMYNLAIVETAELYSGGFGPNYVEAMGGALEVDYSQGSPDGVDGEVQLGAETLAHVGGPLWNGTCLTSYRRTFYDVFLNAAETDTRIEYPYLDEVYASVSQNVTERDRIWLWALHSEEGMRIRLNDITREEGEYKDSDGIDYQSGKDILTAEWQHRFSDSLSCDVRYSFGIESLDRIRIRTSLVDFSGDINTDHHTLIGEMRYEGDILDLEFGGGYVSILTTKYALNGVLFLPDFDDGVFVRRSINVDMSDIRSAGWDNAAITYGFLGGALRLGPLGLRPGINVAEASTMQNGAAVIDPRMQAELTVGRDSALSVAVGQYSRHSLDFFQTKDNPDLKPERSIHYVAGFTRQFASSYRFRIDTYYKDMRNLIVEDPENLNEKADGTFEFDYDNRGEGYSCGVETFLQKKRTADSRLDGWISYTYSVTRRNEHSVDKPGWYAPPYDQPHTLNIVANYGLRRTEHRELNLSATIEYHSGRPYEEFDIAALPLDAETIYMADHNGEYGALPDYFSLDLALEYVFLFKDWRLHLMAEVLNATNHKNVSAYYVPAYVNERREQLEMGIMPLIGIKASF